MMEFLRIRRLIVPKPVQARVVFLLGLMIVLWTSPWWMGLGAREALALQVQIGLILLAILWMFWPLLRWGIPSSLRAELRVPEGQPLALSFDDGPTPGLTDRILDELARSGQKASFFVLVAKARRAPELVRRMVREGHEVGLHGEDHSFPFFRSARYLSARLSRARAELEKIAGHPVGLYRPSHGWKNVSLVVAVKQAGLKFCFWDFGVWDTDAPPSEELLSRLEAVSAHARSTRKRAVLLLHDGRGDPTDMPPHSASLLEALSRWLPAQGSLR